MALKVYILKGTIGAGSPETELDILTTPSGRERRLQEVRVYTSQTSGVEVRLYKNLDMLCQITSEVNNLLKLPYSVTEVLAEGDKLRLTAINSGTSDSDVIVEVVVDEVATPT